MRYWHLPRNCSTVGPIEQSSSLSGLTHSINTKGVRRRKCSRSLPDYIAALDDEALRTLIAYLCEAECKQLGFNPAAVTWGGDQNAPDGGIDVRVSLPEGSMIEGFIPCAETGIQVKATDMLKAAILKDDKGDFPEVVSLVFTQVMS